MKSAILIAIGLTVVYVALSGRLPQVGAVLREAIQGTTPAKAMK